MRGVRRWWATVGTFLAGVAPASLAAAADPGTGPRHGLLGWVVAPILVVATVAVFVTRRLLTTARRRQEELEKLVAARTAELEQLGRLTQAMNSGVRLEDVLAQVYDSFRPLLPYDRIGFALVEGQPATVRAVWARGETEPLGITAGYSAPLEGSSLEQVLATSQPRVLDDLEEYLARHPGSDSTRRVVEEGMRSSLTFPLAAFGRPVGFLFFSSRRRRAYSEDHVRILRQVAGEVSAILEKSRLFEDLLATQQQLERANAALARLAAEDPLTGLPNRRAFDLALDQEWRRAQRSTAPLSALMVDVDHFKAFNDRSGHAAGDRCLVAVATVLAGNLRRAGDLVARHGGEEFALILPDTPRAAALHLAETLRRAVEETAAPDAGTPGSPRVTISVGVATAFPAAGGQPADLVAAADAALYEAKTAGRNVTRARDATADAVAASA